jgi:hypothetical protein
MIHIEKLSLKGVATYTWQTFVDHLLNDKVSRNLALPHDFRTDQRNYISTNIISPYVFPKLKDVSIGKYYGNTGADIDELLLSQPNIENLAIEITVDNINSLPKQKLKRLLESYIVILNDFEEGGTLYGPPRPHLVEILTNLNIKPKMLFLVGFCFQLDDCYPPLNIYKVPFEYWAVQSAIVSKTFSSAIFDKSIQQEMLDKLSVDATEFCAVPLFKPRKNRVELLVQLDKLGILEKTNWSLAYNITKHNYASTVRYKKSESYTDEQLGFLSKYTFPKFLEGPSVDWVDVISPLPEWFNRYKFNVCAETYMGHEISTPMGGPAGVTEKTYKSFLTGAAPIMYAPKGAITHVKNYGFKLLTGEFDTTNPVEVSKLVAYYYKNPTYTIDYKLHNFERITDLGFLTDLVCEPLNKIAELINSIRR